VIFYHQDLKVSVSVGYVDSLKNNASNITPTVLLKAVIGEKLSVNVIGNANLHTYWTGETRWVKQ
jgi:hypothetical protein